MRDGVREPPTLWDKIKRLRTFFRYNRQVFLPESDIRAVMTYGNISREEAVDLLQDSNGDVVDAIAAMEFGG